MAKHTAQQHAETRELIARRLVTPHFQPILDLHSGAVMAWQVLFRGTEPLSSDAEMSAAAQRLGPSARLDEAYRSVALELIAGFPSALRSRPFFIGVRPDSAEEPAAGLQVQTSVASLGLDQRSVVIEITDRQSITDYQSFERQLRQYTEQGFRVAVDDLGAGHAGLLTLATCSPHFLKLGISLTRDIQHHASKQRLIKSLVAFSASVDAVLIAAGVESWDEVETMARLGVRHAQGFLLARPSRSPGDVPDEASAEIRQMMRQFTYRQSDLNEAVGPLVVRCACIPQGQRRGEEVGRMFRTDMALDHIAVVRGRKPVGLITRQSYNSNTGGPVGYPLFQWKPAEHLARPTPLIVEDTISVTALARLAMDRVADELYDPVLVVDRTGDLLGTVTIRQLLQRSNALEVQRAQGSSPLTGLPGNRSIERWILDAFERPESCVLYADLDRFKEFNDCYGFLHGDEMIRCLARVLSSGLTSLAPRACLGHIGGDDFVIVAPTAVQPMQVEALCRRFDQAKLSLFSSQDVERGCFRTTDRRGDEVSIPLVTLSVAVVPVEAAQSTDHPGALAQMAASLKHKVKEMTAASGKSTFLFERRRRRES